MAGEKLMEGKRVVVTGGARGMGRASVLLLAAQGAQVAFCDIADDAGEQTQADARRRNAGCFYMHCDMAEKRQVEAFCDEVERRMGRVDTLVNVVGVNDRQPLVELDMDRFNRIIEINLKSALRLCKRFLPGMAAAGGGSIVNISSIHAVATMPENTSYAASKGGINALSRAIALDFGHQNIRSNTICPGGVYTSEMRPFWEAQGRDRAVYDMMLAYQPLNGPGLADDVANTVLFLASDMAAYVNGATLVVDGGGALQAHRINSFPEPDDYEAIIQDYWLKLEESQGGGP